MEKCVRALYLALEPVAGLSQNLWRTASATPDLQLLYV